MFAVLTAARMLATSSTSGTGVGGDVAVLVPLYLIIIAAFAYAWLRIANKAGYSGWWVLCALLPIIGIVVFFVFAFAPWPALENPYQLSWQPVPSGDQPPPEVPPPHPSEHRRLPWRKGAVPGRGSVPPGPPPSQPRPATDCAETAPADSVQYA